MTGLYVDGPEIGKTVKVCIGKKCKVHNRFSNEESPKQKAAKAAEAQRQRQDSLVKRRAIQAAVEAVNAPLNARSDQASLMIWAFGEMHADRQKELMGLFQIERVKGKHGGWDQWTPTVKWLRAASDVDIARFQRAAVLQSVTGHYFHKELEEEAQAIYRRAKVDPDKIRKLVIAESNKVETSVKSKGAGK